MVNETINFSMFSNDGLNMMATNQCREWCQGQVAACGNLLTEHTIMPWLVITLAGLFIASFTDYKDLEHTWLTLVVGMSLTGVGLVQVLTA